MRLIPHQFKADEKTRTERITLCSQCEHKIFNKGIICGQCGCFMTVKTWLKGASCPLPDPKWKPVE